MSFRMPAKKPSPTASFSARGGADLAAAVELRAATRADIPAIDAMHFLSVQALSADDYTPAQIEAFIGHYGTYDPALIDAGSYFVLLHAGRVVASGGWSRHLPHHPGEKGAEGEAAGDLPQAGCLAPNSAKVRSVFVHPNYARLGLGSRLVRHAETEARAAGFRLVELWATLTGVPLYARLGYQEVDRFDISAGNGTAVPAVHMARILPSA